MGVMQRITKMKNQYIEKIVATGDSLALLPLRLIAGLTLAAHGAQKLFGWFGGYGLSGTGAFFQESLGLTPGVFWAFTAGAGEFFGGLMIAFGALTRVGAGLNAIAMAVAILLVHRTAFFAGNNGMEYPLILLAIAVTLLIAGGGGASVDRVLLKARQNQDSPLPHMLRRDAAATLKAA
jgi:putative oxidoreductase